MRRSDLAHIVRAASRIVDESDVVIIGSQAILGSFDEHELPRQATFSREADVAFWDDDDEIKSDRVDGAIGEGSQFDASFGYYGQGVSISTAILPEGWRDRLVPLESPETRPGRGGVWSRMTLHCRSLSLVVRRIMCLSAHSSRRA